MTRDDHALVIGEFDRTQYPVSGLALETAWLGIYQVLWWYDHGLLHIHDAPALWQNQTWARKATIAESYIANALGVDQTAVKGLFDRMMSLPRWRGMQRNNPLGHGFRTLICEVLRRWGDDRFEYREEVRATEFYPGIDMPGRSKTPSIDVVAISKVRRKPKAVISCKWGIRHDRISDPTNECTQYKSASIQFQEMDLRYFVATNEIDGQRLDKVLSQPCVDGLVHVSLGFVDEVNSGFTQSMTAGKVSGKLLDLSEFVQLTYTWP